MNSQLRGTLWWEGHGLPEFSREKALLSFFKVIKQVKQRSFEKINERKLISESKKEATGVIVDIRARVEIIKIQPKY